MPDETTTAPTPAQVAQTEAAKQAVAFVFGLLTLVVMVKLQKKMIASQREATAPDAERTERMVWAKRSERAWAWLAGVAWRKAESARLSYERDRA